MSKNTWKDKLQLTGVGLLAVVCAIAAIVFKLSGENMRAALFAVCTIGWGYLCLRYYRYGRKEK